MPIYPYTSGQAAIVQTFAQLRKAFPAEINAGYLKRFGIAPANESYVISILRFLGLIDEDGHRVEDTTAYFFGSDDDFKSGLNQTLKDAFSQLFDEMGDEAFEAQKDHLTNWFRAADKTSELVGQRQASTFQTLAALAGHRDVPTARASGAKKTSEIPRAVSGRTAVKKALPKEDELSLTPNGADVGAGPNAFQDARGVGLTVRIEVNLPPDGDATTYDAIFASIRKHLMS